MKSNKQSSSAFALPSSLQILTSICFLGLISPTTAFHTNRMFDRDVTLRPPRWGPPIKRDGQVPLKVTNKCGEKIWPGIGTQAGTGPGMGGFELAPGDSKSLMVSKDWQGRVWGRTNCSFNPTGTGAMNINGNNGGGAACDSGDCGGVLNCVMTGVSPASLAEYDLAGGTGGLQAFYDISLVDGYNIPIGIVFIPGDDAKLQKVPPNLTNAVCIATAGFAADPSPSGTNGDSSNASYPVPYEATQSNMDISTWCPWDLLIVQPDKPGDGVYPYPDDNIKRPIFDPCNSACAKSNSPSDCCTGAFSDHAVCKPNMYSDQANKVCPDAYGFAFDDQDSTFIIPTGGGFETVFCPEGRSTNILKTFKQQLQDLTGAPGVGKSWKEIDDDARNVTIILEAAKKSGAERREGSVGCVGALVAVVAWAVFVGL